MKNRIFLIQTTTSALLFFVSINGYSADRYWLGKAAGGRWNNPANWSTVSDGPGGASVPGAADVAIFEPKNSRPCAIDAPVNVNRLYISANFKDTVRQNNFPLSIGAGGLLVYGGVFWGGNADITTTGRLTLNGGTVRSSSGILTIQGANCDLLAGRFFHNNGKVRFNNTVTIKGKFVFYDLEFAPAANAVFTLTAADTITTEHTLLLSGTFAASINSGVVVCKGDAQNANSNAATGGTATLIFKGASNQTLSGPAVIPKTGQGSFGNIRIDKTSGALNLKDIISVKGSWTYVRGNVSPGTSVVLFPSGGSVNCQGVDSTMNFNQITFSGGTATLAGNLSVLGKLNIGPGATLNAGAKSMVIGGNWENSGSFLRAQSSVVFNGSKPQSVKKSSGIQDFFNLIVNKAGGKLYLNSPTTVFNTLSLQKGIVVATPTTGLKLTDNAKSEGAGNLSFVAGPVAKTGNDAYTFPLGDTAVAGGAYHPLSISAPAAVTDEFTARYYAANQTYGAAFQIDSLESIGNCEHWVLTRNAGASTVIPTVSWNANSCNVQDIPRLCVAAWNGQQWIALGGKAGASGNKTGTVTALRGGSFLAGAQPILIGLKRLGTPEGILKKKLDAAYYTPYKGYLQFKFDEEYAGNGNKLEFSIYDKKRAVVLSNATPGVAVNIAYKDNRCGLNLKALNPALPPGFYVLEVKDKKGEISQLRFKL